MHKRFGFGAALVFSASACSEAAPASDPSVSADELARSTPIAPVDLLSCAVRVDNSTSDRFFQVHELHCQPKMPSDYPLVRGRFIVEGITADHKQFSAVIEPDQNEDVLVGRLTNDAFPITLQTRIQLATGALVERGFGLMHESTIASLQAHTATDPIVYRAPFSLWAVEIRFTHGAAAYAGVKGYSVPVAPYSVGYNFGVGVPPVPDLDVRVESARTAPASLLLIEPPSRSITLALMGPTEIVNLAITAPGNYEWDGVALKPVSGEAPVPEPDDAGAPVDPIEPSYPEDAGTDAASTDVDAGPADPTPGCGAPGEAPCGSSNNRSCDSGARVDYANNVYSCVACGAAGQTYCGTSQARTCNAGTRVDYANNVYSCVACGAPGQTYCGTAQERTCNAGARVDYANNVYSCVICGDVGQTYCGTAQARTCNDGLRVVYANNVYTCQP